MSLVTRGLGGGSLLATGGMGFSSSAVTPPVVITQSTSYYGGRSSVYDPGDYADFYKGPDLNKILQDDLEITTIVIAAIMAGVIH